MNIQTSSISNFIKIRNIIIAGTVFSSCILSGCGQRSKNTGEPAIMVACYYFPNYHTGDPQINAYFGEGWTEWELVKAAVPLFEGHEQPKVPLWGYGDERDPLVMAQKIDAAADHRIDAFIFDWYYYEDGPFLNRCLDEGFLQAKNTNRIRFSLMWANHSWLKPGKVSPKCFDEICDHIVKDYFTKPNYWLIDGKAYFSINDVESFVKGFGTIDAARDAMNRLRDKAVAAGLKGVHWNMVELERHYRPLLNNPALSAENQPANLAELIRRLGFDSTTGYVWFDHVRLPDVQTDFNYVRDAYFAHWDEIKDACGAPYFPNVSMGWDTSPRRSWDTQGGGTDYKYTYTISNNTPANFQTALQMTKERLLSVPGGPRVLTINCWNEWTEGSYLEPDTKNKMGYLEAVKNVFKP